MVPTPPKRGGGTWRNDVVNGRYPDTLIPLNLLGAARHSASSLGREVRPARLFISLAASPCSVSLSFRRPPAMTTNASYDLLSSLLPTTSFALAYALPLLLVSLALTFAGAFLTLDRTRVFPPSVSQRTSQPKSHARPSPASWTLLLHGGIGGLCSGYVFGGTFAHCTYQNKVLMLRQYISPQSYRFSSPTLHLLVNLIPNHFWLYGCWLQSRVWH